MIDPTELDHCLILDDRKVHIPLRLDGTISYFATRKPSIEEYQEAVMGDSLIDLNANEPDWDPMNYRFTHDEENTLDFEGRLIELKYRNTRLFIPEDTHNDYSISKVNLIYENDEIVKRMLDLSMNDGVTRNSPDNKCCQVQTTYHLQAINRTLDEASFSEDMYNRTLISKYQTSLKSKVAAISMIEPKGISPHDLSKVFRIDLPTAKKDVKIHIATTETIP